MLTETHITWYVGSYPRILPMALCHFLSLLGTKGSLMFTAQDGEDLKKTLITYSLLIGPEPLPWRVF